MRKSNETISNQSVKGNITSGDNVPFWFLSATQPLAFEKLNCDKDTDILVVGGGIAGLTTAFFLAKEGRKVVLVEDGFIGSGETGRSTAQITGAIDGLYMKIEKTFDKHTAELVANSHTAAIEWIENIVKEYKIDCHFKRVDGYLFLHSSDTKETLVKEYESTKRAGLMTEMLNSVPSIAAEEGKWCIKYPNQAQFHILLYMKGLADAFIQLGGKIYTETKAENITKEGATANGYKIKAKHIVVATNTPVNDWITMHTKQWPYRTYVIGAKIRKGKLPYALWWDTGDHNSKWVSQPYHYVRLAEFDEQYDILIAGGEDHRTGQTNDGYFKEEDRYKNLAEWTKKRFPDMETIEFNWSGQVMEPVDLLAYIGKNPGNDNIYITTGFSGNGMTNGILGARIITDIIMGRDNPWINIYNPSRITLTTTGNYLHEVGNMVAQYADWFTKEDIKETCELKQGEGAIINSGMKKITAYKDEENNLHTYTAVCPHLGGILQWNANEKTFDCPLHGSRFTTEGKVINGPATSNLSKIILNEENEIEKERSKIYAKQTIISNNLKQIKMKNSKFNNHSDNNERSNGYQSDGSQNKDASNQSGIESSQLMQLFEDELKDIYWAEKALTKAIPKMIKNATSPELIDALTQHLGETEGQVNRVEQVFKFIGKSATAKKCEAMAGLTKEAEEIMDDCEKGAMRDAGIIAAGQKVEHYEIASYGTLRQFAETLGLDYAVGLLQATLDEEKAADEKLTEVAETTVYVHDNKEEATETSSRR